MVAEKSNHFSYTFSWQNITATVQQKLHEEPFWKLAKHKSVNILNNVNGFVTNGTLLAIMGPSGSGKTTLLAALSHRVRDGVQGKILLNGTAISHEMMLKVSGFVPQHDYAINSLTVFEHLNFMAILKMDRRTSKLDRLRKIISLLDEFGISKCCDTLLGQLSGGERKRVSIIVEMLTDPMILFCDEPTTGLDSSNAFVVVSMLRRYSLTGRIVMCSIHQPASGIFELFDNLMLLATGGRIAYYGLASDTIDYFEKLGMHCPPSYNVAEFLINRISNVDSKASYNVQHLCEYYSSSKMAAAVKERTESAIFMETIAHENWNEESCFSACLNIVKADTWVQICSLLQRNFVSTKRNCLDLATIVVTYLTIITVISIIYMKTNPLSPNGIQDIKGFINILLLETIYQFAYFVFNTFPEEKPLFMREISNGLYSTKAYYVSTLCSKAFTCIVSPLLGIMIVTSISEAFDHVKYALLATVFIITALVGTAYGSFLSVAFDDVNVILTVATAYEVPAYLVSGITLRLSSLPAIYAWMKYLSIIYYPMEAVTIIEWENVQHIPCRELILVNATDTCELTGEDVLLSLGYNTSGYEYNILAMAILCVLFHIGAYFMTSVKSKRRAAF